ncbi:conserved Plasmodium protein, unknown function [Plasmodium berghei]|uniref:Uncharacterized protein n=2 Tax=Plasmodium berghei TaxID=5821 RepID=A0A509AS87_PLABA|nr:conserved Plasmodium protein, unknown function [Plasmodium berghei ANKA]CXI61451.1 conserved Plasmodium protein, unknown function [Plasmodium berghei]SCM23642.1 conserved Plasmodium protein, unknown function [Plasmodium berghei]SCN26701.1 conserved Plasmodium protein, unknown function [Plasmodium berghei]SCO60993.1 conserved Plasmodium protein, unknown function [Plasmodium berghei]SCO63084.1 conserved Plasmodium protein, unknown function [Plasmodium berghei]|eukprot:XP_034422317.1 conserved Plasmodium protein, unknown function [Plasmodium berghei ANKA]
MDILYFRNFLLIISFFVVNNKINIKNEFILLGFFSSFSWKSENNTMAEWVLNSSINNQNKNIRILNTYIELNGNVNSDIAYKNLDKNESDTSGKTLFLNTNYYNYLDKSEKKMDHAKDENKENHDSKSEIEIKELIKKEIEKNNKKEEEYIKKEIEKSIKKERDNEIREEIDDEQDYEQGEEKDGEKDKPKEKKIKKLIHHEIRKINEKIEKNVQESEQEKNPGEIKKNKTIAIEIKNENRDPKIKCSNKLNYIELEYSNIDKKLISEKYNNDVISFINIKTKDKIYFRDKINENITKIKDHDANKISNIEQMEVEPNIIKKDQNVTYEQIKNKNKMQGNAILHNNNHAFLDSKEYNNFHTFFNNNLKNINKHTNSHKYNNNLNGITKSHDITKGNFTIFITENQEDDSLVLPINFERRNSVLNISNDEYTKLMNEGSVLVYDKDEVVPYKYDAFEVKNDSVNDMKENNNNDNNSSNDSIYRDKSNDASSQNNPEEEDQFKGTILTCVTVIIILAIMFLIGFIIYYYDIINKLRVKFQKKGKNNKSMTIKNDKSSGMYIDNYYDNSTHV